jgi:hypothetical protein
MSKSRPTKLKVVLQIEKDKIAPGTKYAELCDIIREENLSNSEIASLLIGKGFTPGSAHTTASYLLNLSKAENANILEAIRSGKETIRNARKLLAKKQMNPARSEEMALSLMIEKAAKYAIEAEFGRDAFLEYCADAFDFQSRANPPQGDD